MFPILLMVLGSILMFIGSINFSLVDVVSIWILGIPIYIGAILVLTGMYINAKRFKLL